jgi:GDPmannose 4,6-dehydratase
MVKKALITGITGQDGSYLAEFLLKKGYEVYGMVRRTAAEDPIQRLGRIKHLLGKVKLYAGSVDNYASVLNVVSKVKPDECYHLAAQSFVKDSFEDEFSTLHQNINGTTYVLSAIKNIVPKCKVYFAASSEMFGDVTETPQNEKTPFWPRSPYGISKLAGYHLVKNYRESYDMFACSGILFNHESPRRGFEFVTRKITSTAAKIKLGLAGELVLGNLDAKRDWGYSKEYIEAMWLMLQQDKPDDFVIATGETHTVREFCKLAFEHLGLDYRDYVRVDPAYYRPAEVHLLCGDMTKAGKELRWKPKTTFRELVKKMVDEDIKLLKIKYPQKIETETGGVSPFIRLNMLRQEMDRMRHGSFRIEGAYASAKETILQVREKNSPFD